MTRLAFPFLGAFLLTMLISAVGFIYYVPYFEFARLEMGQTMTGTPHNTFRHLRELADHTSTAVVRPNNDTLYSSAFLDLSGGPLILTLPETGERYYSVQFMDPMTEVYAVVSRRTRGGTGGVFEIVREGSEFDLGADVAHTIVAPSDRSWVLVRILIDGPDDLAAVHALQDQVTLEPATP